MEIIEKQVEKVKEVPYGYHDHKNVNGKANAGLTLGIIGTALGAWSLFGNKRGLGFPGTGMGGANININGLDAGSSNGISAPSAFQVWEKEYEDTLALQKGLYDWALVQQSQRFSDRQTVNSEMFGIYKSQVDADFGLYKSTRDGFDVINAKHNQDAFGLYKSQRDSDDAIMKELSDLKTQVAINAAIRPYQDKLIQCEIDKAFTAGVNYTDRKTCKMIEGRVVLPNTPIVTGYGSFCCPGVQSSTATQTASE